MNRKSQLEFMRSEDPQNSFVLFALAKEYEGEGNAIAAIELMEELRRQDPLYTGLYYHLASLYKQTGQTLTCREILMTGINVCETHRQAHDLAELRQFLMNLEIDELEG
ncbi:MAG: hypothetical protein U0V49_09830 [Saprospiraceae bacterium]